MAGGTGSRDTFEVYDPATNSWTTAGAMLVGRYRSSIALVDGGILIFGGQGRDGVLAKTELFSLGIGAEVAAQVRTGTAVEQEPTPEIAPDATATPRPTPTPKPLNLAFEFPDPVDANPTGETTLVELGVPVRLPLGQEMTSPKGVVSGMTARFVKVIEDTRCPAGQTCEAQGEALGKVVIQISLRADSPLGTSELTIEDGQAGTTIKRYGKFSVGFLGMSDDGTKATLVILLSN